jgi:PAS domain S-box-containing protein
MTPRTTVHRGRGRTTPAGPVTGEAAHFARSFAGLPTPAFLVDGHGEFVWVNRAFAALAGLGDDAPDTAPPADPADGASGAAERPGRASRDNVTSLYGTDHRTGYGVDYETDSAVDSGISCESVDDLAARSAGVLSTGLPLRVEKVQFRRPSGEPRWATGSAFALPTADGALAAGAFHELVHDAAGDLARLLVHTPLLVATTDLDLRYTWAAGSLPGDPDADRPLVGRTAWEVADSSDPAHPWVAPLLRALRGEHAHQRAEHRGAYLDQWVGPLRDPHGRAVGTVAVVVDATEAARAAARQRAAEEKFRLLVDNSPALVDVRDGDDRIVLANPAFLRTFGVRLPDVIGWRPDTELPGAAASDVADLIETGRRVRETGRARVWQGRVPHPDGQPRDLLGHVFPLPGTADGSGDGPGDGVGEVFIDVTAHERARRELAESEQRFRALFTGAEIGVLMIALDGTVLDANPAALRLSGRALHEVRGQDAGIALSPADVERNARLWAELVAGRRGRYDLTVALRSSDGRQRPARFTVTLVRSTRGAPAMALGLAVPLAPENDTVAVPARSVPSAGEAAVLERLAAGASLQQIASDLGMSRRGVDYRITRLRHKLRADGPGGAPTNSAALIARAYALGILHPAVWPPRVVDLQPPDDTAD